MEDTRENVEDATFFDLFDLLLDDYAEAVDHIGLSHFENRLAWWYDLRRLSNKENVEEQTRRRCLENWPVAVNGEYHPSCCRFPKSCSIPENTGKRL